MDTSINYQLIGERIRDKRLEKDMSQETLSAYAGIATKTLSSIENGKVRINLDSLLKIAHALDATVNELTYGNLENVTIAEKMVIEELLAASSSSERLFLLETILAIKKILLDHGWHF